MADLATIRVAVQERLSELEELLTPLRAEAEQLEAILRTFGSTDAQPQGRRAEAAGAPARRSAKKRSPATGGGRRSRQALERIEAEPGITVPELAQAMAIKPNYLYRVLPGLVKAGEVAKHGKGYHRRAQATSSPAA